MFSGRPQAFHILFRHAQAEKSTPDGGVIFIGIETLRFRKILTGLIKSTCESGYDTEAELHTVVGGHGFLERTSPRFHGLRRIIGQPEFTEQFDAIITHMKRGSQNAFDIFCTALETIEP